MSEDLRRANESYKKLLKEAKKQKGSKLIDKKVEILLYLFYLAGFSEGSGMTQVL